MYPKSYSWNNWTLVFDSVIFCLRFPPSKNIIFQLDFPKLVHLIVWMTYVKFSFSEKAIRICAICLMLLNIYLLSERQNFIRQIVQIFVAFSEKLNFNNHKHLFEWSRSWASTIRFYLILKHLHIIYMTQEWLEDAIGMTQGWLWFWDDSGMTYDFEMTLRRLKDDSQKAKGCTLDDSRMTREWLGDD